MMIYIILIISFLLESSFSNIININSLFTPLFLLTSLVLLYPYFKKSNSNFIIVCVICGLIYDISFSDSAFINALGFGLSGGLIILGYNYVNYNIYSSNFMNLIVIIFYRIVSYILLCIVDYIHFNEANMLEGIYNSIVINIIYGVVTYIIIDLIAKIFNIKRVE